MGCDYPLRDEVMGPLLAGPCSPCEAWFSPPVGQAVRSICVKADFLKLVMVKIVPPTPCESGHNHLRLAKRVVRSC